MNVNEIVGSLKAGGLDASSTNRSAAVYVTEARGGRAVPGWFGFRIVCDSEATERRVRAILSRWYDIDANGNVWRLRSRNRVPLMAIKRGGVPPTPPTPTDGPMYFEAAQSNSTVSMMSMLATAPDLEYSTDGETWQEWQHTTADGTHTFDTLTLAAVGNRVYMRGSNPNGLADFDNHLVSSFLLSGKINAGGNIMSLLDKTMAMTVVPTAGFAMLFNADEPDQTLVSLPDMSNITSVGDMGFMGMYTNRAAITSAANMPSITTIGEDGCLNMFSGCTGLTQAPSLPATTLAESCYYEMFSGCTGLTQAPSLPATTLAESCYYGMFSGCTGLTQAPSLPATTLAESCYSHMFIGCTFEMSSDGTTFNFAFGATPPVTAGSTTYSTYYDIAQWMGNTNGFNEP